MGSGPNHILALHGFGDNGSLFLKVPVLMERYTVHAFDLPFHGSTIWKCELPFDLEKWTQVLQDWQAQEAVTSFEIWAYSMGGKYALSALPVFAKRISRLVLLAADGINLPFYRKASPFDDISWYLSSAIIYSDRFFFFMIKCLCAFHLLDSYSERFAKRWMATKKQRKEMLLLWRSLRHFSLGQNDIDKKINSSKIPVHLVWGEQDRVVPATEAVAWAKNNVLVKLDYLQTDHMIVDELLNGFLENEAEWF